MISKLAHAARLGGYPSFRAIGFPKLLPINLTVSVTYNCPSRCETCDIWQKTVDDMSVDEFSRTFRSLGHAPMSWGVAATREWARARRRGACSSPRRRSRGRSESRAWVSGHE